MSKHNRYGRITDILLLYKTMKVDKKIYSINEIAEKLNISRRTAERIRDCMLVAFDDFDVIRKDAHTKYFGVKNVKQTINNN